MKKLKNFIHKHENLEKLALFIWAIFRIVRAKLIFRKIKDNLLKNNFKVIILGIRTIPTTDLVYFDAIFGHAFKKLGAEVKMLYCDGVLDSCDADIIFRNQNPQCFICRKFGNSLKKSLNLDCISYRDYISPSDIEKIKREVASLSNKELLNYKYLGINVGEHAHASAIRYFLFGRLDLNDPNQVLMLREKLVYAMIAAKIADGLVQKQKPDCIIMLHGIYSTWGPFLEYFQLKGIDTVVYSLTPRFGHFIFIRNNKRSQLISEKTWSIVKNLPLKDEEEREFDNYFSLRVKGETADHQMYKRNFDNKTSKTSILETLSKKKYSRRYVMYPNLAWDAAIEGDISKCFNDVFDWIDKTIEFFKKKKDYQLIIKPHPGELIWEGCKQGVGDYVIEKHSPLPENITLLKPDTPLRAYDLITTDTIGIVFNGTLGLELAVLGVPMLVVADDVHYKKAGVVYNIETQKEYLELLENPKKLIQFAKANVKLAKKYADFYFFKLMIRIPFYHGNKKWATIDWRVVSDVNKLLDDNSNLIKICKKIINKEDIVLGYEEDIKNYKKS